MEIKEFKEKLLIEIHLIKTSELKLLLKPEFLLYISLNNTLSKFFNIFTEKLKNLYVWEFFALLASTLGETDIAKRYWRMLFSYSIRNIRFFLK